MSDTLETMAPNPVWDAGAYEDTVATLDRFADCTFKIWGGDWCVDCRSQLPDFGAALDASDVPDANVEHYPVEKAEDGSKVGPKVAAYDIEYIPTVVVERPDGDAEDDRDGEELTRFVEAADVPIAVYLAQRLQELEIER
jgi:thiol-disulfide isomerase/thioredoxin